jgi:hypothetical protein
MQIKVKIAQLAIRKKEPDAMVDADNMPAILAPPPPRPQPDARPTYLPPYDLLCRSLTISEVGGSHQVSMGYDDFIKLIKLLCAAIDVDEEWYLRQYDDVRSAVEAGSLESARKHFIDDGYFEGRLPFPMDVDEAWYLEQYPDVAEGVRNGTVASATQHFQEAGYREGRFPAAM